MKYSYSKQLFSLSICFFCINTFSQTEIKSKILDFLTFLPIESASIYLKNTTIGTISNADGKFVLFVPREFEKDTLIISSIGYKSFKTTISDFDSTMDVYLEEDIASLDEVLLIAETRPKTGNDIVLRAIKRLSENLPEQPYLLKGFLRHKERNKKEFKWLIESALTLYDSSYASGAMDNLKINVDEIRNLAVVSPLSDEQGAIAEFLEQRVGRFDQLQAEAQRAIELLQERRTALISAAVTGKIDVREFALLETA